MKGIKNTKARRNKVLKSAMKRTLSAFIAFTFVFNLFPSAEVGYLLRKGFELTALAANKDTVPEGTVYSDEQARVTGYYDSDEGYYLLSSVNEVLDYSRAYYSFSAQHQNDVICINFGEGDSTSAINNFLAIGTDSRPFNGTIMLVTNSINTLNIPEAFFDYIYDSATIISETTDQPSPLILTRTMDASGEPVLARHVRHNNIGEPKTWQIQIDSYDEENYSVGGFIGEMEDDAQVILDIIDNTSCDTYGTSDIGYVCGKMGEGSSLTVNSIKSSTGNGSEKEILDATNTNYSVSTINGNAGGVVGSMEENAELIMNCSASNPSASVTAAGEGKYAGGIVGYNDGGSIVPGNNNNAAVFSSLNKYRILNTLSGTAGSGGVFGYYRPAFESKKSAFDISWLQIGTTLSRMDANGTGSVGGLFGVLVNEIKTTENETTTYSAGSIAISDGSNNSAVVYLDHGDSNSVAYYGGLIGKYTACDLEGALQVKDVSVNVNMTGGSYDNYGGAIGITEGGNGNDTLDALYVSFNDYNVTVAGGNAISTSVYGGLVARSANAFIDAKNVTCNSTGNFYGGGVIGRMDDGVLRLSGTTNLTGGYALISNASYYNEGQIVGGRDSSLVFAEKDWVLKRSTACSVDDIGSWGEVLRFNEISTTENGGIITSTDERYSSNTVLTVDETAHTVTISAPATQTTIGSVADYAMLSLCFQLKATDGLPVLFDDAWSYDYSDIISQDITLGATFSLAGTGLTGLTRDNAETASDTAAHCVYKGKFDGGNNTLTLAIGEPYGQRGNSVLTDHTAQGNGKIYRHIYTGLWGIIDGTYNDSSNYTVKNITLSGTVDINAQIGNFYCGGFASRAIKDFTANNVKTQAVTTIGGTTTGFRMTHSGSKVLYMGGLVGEMGTAANTIVVKNSEFSGTITGNNGGNANVDEKGTSCIGGVIGKISHNKDELRNWSFSSVTLKGTVSNTFSKSTQRIGGLVAEINGSYNANTKHRTLTLDDIEVDGLKVSGVINSAGSAGGLLGYSWLKTDVNITDVTVKNTATVDIGSATGNAAGIVYRATGHWTVTNLGIQSLKMTATNAASVGAIVNKGYFYSGDGKTFYTAENCSAIYLELPASYTYNLVFTGESINSSAIFDELCAYTCPSGSDILKNGNGIISIHSGLYTDGSTASGSYHAQTSYGVKPNPNARYYYNLDTVTNNTASNLTTPQMKLMSWGVNKYACTNLKQYFADPFNVTITDLTYDMSGYSWYPVDLDSSITVNGTFTFYNKEFEDSEKVKCNAETAYAYKRTSLYDSTNSSNTQHYLMHNGMFHDVNSCTMTVGHVVLSGGVAGYAVSAANISAYSASVCGALVCGTVSGSSSSNVGTIKMGTANNASISLAGIKVYNVNEAHDNALRVSEYAPLLINKLGSHSTLNLRGISTTTDYNYDSNNDSVNDSSYISATSLIGDAGNSSALDVNIDFKLVTLDGRNATGKTDNDLSDTSKGNFLAMYHTYNSIFSKATLLNSFSFDSGSSGRYNFTWNQDWDANDDNTADSSHDGNVTYGKELGYDSGHYPKTGATSTHYFNTQYPDEEFMYSGEGTRYSNPITASDTTHSYWGSAQETNLFVKNFLPYVAEKYNAANKKYQLQVNHASKEKSGCGTYNDPYVISSGNDIEDFCYWINNDAKGAKILIPTSDFSYDSTDVLKITSINGTWCDNQNSDVLCEYDTSASCFKCTFNYKEYKLDESVLRTYLAGAYYKIADEALAADLVIDDTEKFTGFGKQDSGVKLNNVDVYPYRFRGVFDGNKKTIVNQTSAPFIYYSNGSVVKDLTISVEPASAITIEGKQANFEATNNNGAYGAIMARVMGGDNIIDNVSVGYSSMSTKINVNGKFAQLAPVGGYVGVIVSGGVYFRNMGTVAASYFDSTTPTGLQNSQLTSNVKSQNSSNYSLITNMIDSKNWLYVNPVVGRVINGFAVTESNAYRPYEDGTRTFGDGTTETGGAVTLKNGTKHYSIADITSNDQIVISSNAVTVSGGQDFFLMSLIVNSGMAKNALGYNHGYQVSRSAAYSNVGTTESSCADYTSYAINDKLSSSGTTSEFGYLAKKYVDNTSSTGNLANNGNLTITLSGDVILPDGYKGMGNIYQVSSNKLVDNYLMKVKTLTGNGHIISQNSSFLLYHLDLEKNYYPISQEGYDGFGLFNYQAQSGTYTNVILKGNVTTDLINHLCSPNNVNYDADKGYAPYEYTNGNMNKAWLPATGSLFGVSNAAMTLQSVALQNVKVCGTRYTGGMIGYHPANSTIKITNTVAGLGSDKIIVHGGLTVGGLIGKKQQGELEFNNAADSDGTPCSFNITEVISLCTDMTDSATYYNYGVGGLVGACRGKDKSTSKVTLKNFTMGSSKQESLNYVKCEKATIYTGGLFGILNRQYLVMEDCTINNVSVKTKLAAGGIVGHWATSGNNTANSEYLSVIDKVKLLCNLEGAEITSLQSPNDQYCAAGGILGSGKQDMAPLKITNSEIRGYAISGYAQAGGVVGSWGDSSTTGGTSGYERILTVNNVVVSDSQISSTNGSAGGIVGKLGAASGILGYYYLYGYNNLCYNLSIGGKTDNNSGYICGYNEQTDKNAIKLVGFSKQDNQTSSTMIFNNVGIGGCGNDKSGNEGYVVFTDYTGSCLNNDYSDALSNITNTSGTDIAIASPYVTVTDKEFIDGTNFLTGDAMGYNNSIAYSNSRIGSILTAASRGTDPKRYGTASSKVGSAATTNLISKLDTYGKYASYQKQMGAQAGTSKDFPVLVLDDATDNTATALINNYLRYLTNTDYDFAACTYSDGTSAIHVFNVEIGACVWDASQSKFRYQSGSYSSNNTDGAYLYKRNSKFSIADANRNIKYDNETGKRFTLIDVQFYDPSDTSNSRKIAYHLYVPVLVKKMLYYDFRASFLSGTNYRVAPYTAKRGNTLIENIGNPVTLEVSWIYDRDLAGWQAALESGDDFYHTTFEKRLKAQNHNNGIPEGTKMVLVDANRKNAHYYANQDASGLWTASGAYYNFDFSAFTGFTKPALNDYFNVTATEATLDTEVKFKRVANNESFIISDGTYYYAIDESGEWELTLSYKNTIATTGDSENTKDGKIVDDYYITFFTDVSSADKDLYHLEFFDWESFENDKYPTHVSTNDHTHILTGNIFINDNFNINNLKSNTKMSLDSGSDYNDTIQATFSVDVGVNEDIKNDIKTYFNMTSVEVYQSFLIMLNRQDLSSSLQGIATRPDLIKVSNFTIKHGDVTDYTIDTDPDTDAGMTDPYRLTTANYIELRGNKDLRTYMRTASLTAGLTYSISATWELSYTDSTKLAAQFPTRDTSNINNTSIGTLIGGSSNMSSTPEAAVYSKNVAKLENDRHEEITWVSNYSYYCTINTNAKLTLNSDDADNENGEFYQLGINANDIDPDELTENGYVPMKLKAVYDVSNLSAADTVESMKLTFTVSQKPNYGTALTFADYVDGLNVYSYDAGSTAELPYAALTSGTGISIDTTTATDKVVYIVDNPDEVFDYDSGSKVYQIPVTFNAIIGDDFGNSKEYANYMIRLEIEMYTKASDADGWATSSIDGSNDDDHVIFTHAKLITSIIE